MGKDEIKTEKVIHCPKCGRVLRIISKEVETVRGLGIVEYDMYCDDCDVTVNIEDRSSLEQEGKILITLT